MNYYEHHLGDYDSATAHLSWLEDCAYRRMLCLYYRTEAPLPVDVKQVCRLVRASSKPERDAVQQVLTEFFKLSDDGWHNARCDEDIAAFHELEPEREAKRENAKERQRRARARRADLFEALRGHNIVPPFDTTTKALESLLSRVTSAQPVTPPDTAHVTPVTCDDTATHTHPPPPPSPCQISPSEKDPPDGGSGHAPGAAPPTPPRAFDGTNAEALNGKAVVPISAAFTLPGPWGIDAEALGFKPAEVMREGEKFRQYWVDGKGKGTRRSVKGWRQTWSNWLDKAARDHR